MNQRQKDFDFVCVGGATQDVFVSSDASKVMTLSDIREERQLLCFDYGGKLTVDHIEFTTGGGATNTAVSLARLGARSAFVGKTGTDRIGRLVLEELGEYGVDTSYGLVSEARPTGYSVILTSFEGDRTVLVHRGANEEMKADEIDWSFIDRTGWLYVTSLSGGSAELLGPLAERAVAAGLDIAFNPGSTQLEAGLDGLGDILRATTVLLLNKEEAARLSGKPPVKDVIIESRCDLCGKCIEVCPAGVFVEHHGRIALGIELCDQCGRCLPACPNNAIAMEPWTFNVTEAFDALTAAGPDVVVI
ncbi:MAG: PfkB family carbohydrate kinase, partial [Planctomycetota bacterium]